MKIINSPVVLLVFIFFISCREGGRITWIESTDDGLWTEKTPLNTQSIPSPTIVINNTDTLQTISGFGGCFNELGWEALNLLDPAEREKIISRVFGANSDLKFRIGRVPIGANDYALDWYSLNDTPGDYEMKNFNIDRDKTRLIPFLKMALKYEPDLKVWGSPWCPPAWMKTNQHYACRMDKVNDLCCPEKEGKEGVTQFILIPEMLDAYARYFSLFVRSYRAEGIPVYAVHVQNEPNSCQNFPSCIWKASDIKIFIGQYLGPRFRQDRLHAEIWYGTIERPYIENIDTVLQDTTVTRYITGLGFQWAGKGAIKAAHEKYPNLKLMQTESECGDGSNDWKAAEYTFSLIKHYLYNGANSYLYWNMVLDETGNSRWGWKQNSLISINKETKKITYNPEYYLFKHISHFVQPGAKMLRIPRNGESTLIFLNPGNSLVIVTLNPNGEEQNISYDTGNGKGFSVSLKPHSLNTFIIDLTHPA